MEYPLNHHSEFRVVNLLRILVLAVSVTLGIYFLSDSFLKPYVINNDAMLHVFWMRDFRDPGVFSDDLLARYARHVFPVGTAAVYRAASGFLDPLTASKVLQLAVFSLSSLYAFNLARQVTGSNYCGLFSAAVFMLAPCFLNRISGGHPRAFGYLLLMMFLYHLVRKEYGLASLAVVLQALLYPLIAPVSLFVFAASIVFVSSVNGPTAFRRACVFFGAAVAVFAAVVCTGSRPDPQLGRMASREEIIGNPSFHMFGRRSTLKLPMPSVAQLVIDNLQAPLLSWMKPADLPLRPELGGLKHGLQRLKLALASYLRRKALFAGARMNGIWFFMSRRGSRSLFPVAFLWVSLVTAGYCAVRRSRFLPPEFVFLFFAGICLFVAAYRMLPRMFIPGRYLEYSLPLLTLMVLAAGAKALTGWIKNHFFMRAAQAALLLSFVFYFANANKGNNLIDLSRYGRVYEFARSLPRDVRIAGHPRLVDGIPLFSGRTVFVTFSVSYPFFRGYWASVSGRTIDFFSAYYSSDASAVADFCRRQGIGWLIVDETHFSPRYLSSGDFYFQPFNSRIEETVRGRDSFALMAVPVSDRIYLGETVFAVKAEALQGED